MNKGLRLGIAVLFAVLTICAIIWARHLQSENGCHRAASDSSRLPSCGSFHRRPIKGGFLLMFDKPIVREASGDDPEVDVLGIGRARVDLPKLDGTKPLEFVGVKSDERAVVIVKVKRKGWLFAPFERNGYDRVWDIGTDTASRLACRLALGSRSLQLPPDLDPRVVSRDQRVQPVVFYMPDRADRVFDAGWDATIDLVAVNLDAKPDFGPATVDQLRDRVLDVGEGVRMMFIDWVLHNPFQATGWRGVRYRPSSPMYKEHYLDLRFLGASAGNCGESDLYALVQGASGQKVLLREYSRSWGGDTGCGYVGVHTETDPTSGYERVDNCRAKSPGDKAGIRNGDLIVDVNGRPAKSESLWAPCVGDPGLEIGVPVPVKILRNGKTLVLTMIPIEHPDYTGTDSLRRGIYSRNWHRYSALLAGIPHTGGPATRVRALGKARIGTCLLSSLDPVPADFRPVKVSIFIGGYCSGGNGHAEHICRLEMRSLNLPAIPIPPEFWK